MSDGIWELYSSLLVAEEPKAHAPSLVAPLRTLTKRLGAERPRLEPFFDALVEWAERITKNAWNQLGSFSHHASASAPAPRRRGPGRPRQYDPAQDKRIYDAWNTGDYPTYADLAPEFGGTAEELKKAVDRYRQRVRRRERRKR